MVDESTPGAQNFVPIPLETPLMDGTPVVAADGESLGTIAEVATDRFKVAVPLARDYWLPRLTIAGMAPGGDIVLTLTSDQVEHAHIPAPDSG
jgi:hypothetical protein